MSVPAGAARIVFRLKAQAARHRAMAVYLTCPNDRGIALSEAARADLEADRIHAEVSGNLIVGIGAAPLHEQI